MLLFISFLGLSTQLVTLAVPHRQPDAAYPSFAWGISIALLLAEWPRTAPLTLMLLITTLLISNIVILQQTHLSLINAHLALPPMAALSGLLIMLNMPLRDPSLPDNEISRPFTPPTVDLRSPEDALTPWQYMTVSWMGPLVRKAATSRLEEADVWSLAYEFKHDRLHAVFKALQGSVTTRVLRANGIDIVGTTTLALVGLALTLLSPVLLQRILSSMNDPASPRSATLAYATLLGAARLLVAQCDVFKLWYSRRAYERSRGEMITMLYEKTLNRKILGAKQPKSPENTSTTNTTENDGATSTHTSGGIEDEQRPRNVQADIQHFFRKVWSSMRAIFSKKPKIENIDEDNASASTGKILNLMRNDVYEVSQRLWDFPDFVLQPIGAIATTFLIWRMIGWACLLGAVALLVTQAIYVAIARFLIRFEKKRRAVTDQKLQRTTQFIESIRHLRWYGWQDAWRKGIMEVREKELRLRIVLIALQTTLAFLGHLGTGAFPAIAFYALTVLIGKPLTVDLIFPAMELMGMLERYLQAIPALIMTWLNAFVAIGRIEKFMQEPDKEQELAKPGSHSNLLLNNASFAWPGVEKEVLHDLTLTFPPGITVIYGEVASGKTALLAALLGELDKTGGEFVRPQEVVGYCAQLPWLQSMSIRENILFSSPYDQQRYRKVLEACALLPDMVQFKNGDLTNIGENGVGLSGGQKARVALARAVYSHAKVVVLDDPLSALDHQTAELIVRELLTGSLMDGRTVILVTHRTDLLYGLARQWIKMDDGCAYVHEPTQAEESSFRRSTTTETQPGQSDGKDGAKHEVDAATPDKFIEDEHRASGGVKLKVYWRYIKAGTLTWWSLSLVVMALYHICNVGKTYFLKAWAEGYNTGNKTGLFDWLPPPGDNVVPWLQAFSAFVIVTAILFWWTYMIMFAVGYHAAKAIFEEAIDRIARATFRFYDITPVGRLMNRITSDMGTVDGHLSIQVTVFAWVITGWLSSIVVIVSSTPAFMVFGVVLCCGYVYYFYRFLPTSQNLRRLEMVSLTPLLSNFGALTEGLVTIRAFSAQQRFLEGVFKAVDQFQKNDHFYWSLQAWLSLRFSVMSAFSGLIMTFIALYMEISAGLTAFLLITVARFVQYTESLCRTYGNLEMDFTSVERVVELLDIEKESPGVVDPPAHWPTISGDIVFEDATVRYADNLDPALSNITLTIPAGSNTAVVGRTGSGKSTLALSLLATVMPESGRILIDGIDIATVKRQVLRSRVTFLAQEPVLFPGSMRKNLDPLDEYSDAACESVLSKAAPSSYGWSLSTNIEAGGKGLSQGQRQLVGLARAMLRRSAVLIMDEATASIDFETAQKIQEVLREEMKGSTVVTIAHRLEAVKNADYCVVLGKGKVIRAGRAKDMLENGGEVASMLA